MGLEEQRTAALALQGAHHLPRIGRMLLRIGADQADRFVTQVARGPYRPEHRVDKVRTAPRVRRLANLHQFGQLALLGVDDRDLVGSVGCVHEIAMRRLEATVVQEGRGVDHLDAQVVEIAVIHRKHLARLLHVDEELGIEMRGGNGRDTRLGMVILRVHGHAAGGHDFSGLERVAVHDDELRRPVGAGNRVLVLPSLGLGALDRTRLHPDLDFRDGIRLLHPQVDQIDLGIAANDEEIASGRRHAGDVHRITGVQDADNLLAVTVDEGNLAGIAQRHREQVVEVQLVHLFARPLVDRHHDFP